MADPSEFTDDPVDTGFTVTATVTASGSELTQEAIQAAKALVNLPDISPVALAQLARDIAQDIAMLPAILQKHKLTKPQYEFLETHNAYFRSVLASETQAWQSIKSTELRLKLQAQAALEATMPVVASRIANAAEDLRDVVEGAKFLSRVAGVDAPASGPITPGERYQIVIDLGADTNVVIAAKGGAAASAGPDQARPVPPNAQRQGDAGAVRRDGQGQSNLLALPGLPEG